MLKVLFLPFSIIGSLIAGLIARKAFDGLWSVIDNEDPPEPEDEDARWPKLLAAAALQAAVFALARVFADRQARVAFTRVTGTWPGGGDDDD